MITSEEVFKQNPPGQRRQGDVLLHPVEVLPLSDSREVIGVDEGGLYILARGSSNGATHRFADSIGITRYKYDDGKVYVALDKDNVLVHDRHKAIPVPAGVYQVITQKEVIRGSYRDVRD